MAHFAFSPVRERSIVISVSVCLCVCLSICLSVSISPGVLEHIFVHVDYGRGLVLLWRCCDVTNFRFHR